MGTGSFPEAKRPGAWRWPPTPIYRRGSRNSRAIPLFHLWPFVACSTVNFTLLHCFVVLKR